MAQALSSKLNDCRSCYKCIRNCPTKSISFRDGHASIDSEGCVLCGKCFLVCPQNAKEIRNDIEVAKELLKGDAPVYVSIAPSFLAAYPGASFATFEKALKALGFAGVEETAIGATIVKNAYDEMCDDGKHDVIISTCCHSINLLIEKYYPEAIQYLANVLSPMRAHAQDIKRRHEGAKVVFIGPCVSKKNEADMYPGFVDCVLTFLEFDNWLKEAGVEIESDPNPVRIEESLARLFPTEGGILATMKKDNPSFNYLSVGGMEESRQAIEDVLSGKVHNAFIEMSSCIGSCINGPAMKEESRRLVSNALRIHRMAGSKDFKTASYSFEEIKTRFFKSPKRVHHYTDEEIEAVLRSIGKTSKEDELNCASCGYPSCREKAIAVLDGKASVDMCLPYLMEKTKGIADHVVSSVSSPILALDESLKITLSNHAMTRLVGVKSRKDLYGHDVGEFFDPSLFALALGGTPTSHKKIYSEKYNKYLMVDVVYKEKYQAIIAVFQDISEEESRKRKNQVIAAESAKITEEIVEKNMRAVQEIAQLLGESTAETKVALKKLADTIERD
jgi:iron only hydrogenase large subunit-like protein